jgi:hypothetical protein
VPSSPDHGPLDAGPFGEWLLGIRAAIDGTVDADVACGSCDACCRSGQFVHVGPEDLEALVHIPAELLFPAPQMPPGHLLMGYDHRGRCPMLGDHGCTIYEHRPRTCRTYDCRVFPAADVYPTEPEKADIAARARRWVFRYPVPADAVLHEQVRSNAAALRRAHPDAPATPLAVRAVSASHLG